MTINDTAAEPVAKWTDDDWAKVRKVSLSAYRPDEWPDGVRAISLDGLTLLGVHEKTLQLYWDGRKVLLSKSVRLGSFERWIASLAAFGTFGNFIVQAGRSVGWWG